MSDQAGAAESRAGSRAEKAAAPSPLPPLRRNRDYNLWWSGAALSQLGSELTQLAYPLLILGATGSAAQAGVVGTFGNIGFLAGSVPAGLLADRVSRRALIAVSALVEMAAVATMFAAVATGHVWIVQIAAVALVQGVATAVGGGARMPMLRRIVPEPQLKTAFARDHAREMGAQLAGPPLGGVLFSTARWIPFLADLVSFAFVVLAALFVRTPLGPDRDASARRATLREDLAEGLRVLWGDAFLRFALVWAAVINMLLGGLSLLFVVTLRAHGAPPSVIGGSEAIVAGCGLAGALAAAQIIARMSGRRIVILVTWLLVGGTVGIALLARWPWPAGLAFGSVVFFVTPLNVTVLGHVMKLVPEQLTGRVMAAIGMAAQCLKWLAPIAVGLAADGFGATAPILVIAVLFAGLAVVNHLVKAIRGIDDEPGSGADGASGPKSL